MEEQVFEIRDAHRFSPESDRYASRGVQKTTAAMVSQITKANQVEHDGGRQEGDYFVPAP